MKIKDQYYLIDDYTFRKINEKNSKKIVSFEFVKPKIRSLSEFKKAIKGKSKSYPEIFSKFELFIYIPRGESEGCLIEVEKIWLVEDKTDN